MSLLNLELRTEELVQQQASECQQVGLEFFFESLTLGGGGVLDPDTGTDDSSGTTSSKKPLHNLHAPSAGDDQCEHNAVGDELSPGRSMVPTILSLYLEPTSHSFPGISHIHRVVW